jgi:integrase
MFMVRRAFAKGRLKGILFPAPAGGRIEINNWRHRQWTPALAAAGIEHRRIYDLRHTYAAWSLAASLDIFTLARRMGTSVKMIDQTYGHLVAGADVYERELLDAFDEGLSSPGGRYLDASQESDAA